MNKLTDIQRLTRCLTGGLEAQTAQKERSSAANATFSLCTTAKRQAMSRQPARRQAGVTCPIRLLRAESEKLCSMSLPVPATIFYSPAVLLETAAEYTAQAFANS
jgi:hypothetical protein